MALLYGWALPLVTLVWGRAGARTVSLVLGVVVCWLVIFGVVARAVPTPEIVRNPAIFAFALGDRAYIHVPSGAFWQIPIDRVTYYEVDRALLDDDEETLNGPRARPGWVVVLHGQVVSVIEIDRVAVRVELLEGQNTGGRGWLKEEHLRLNSGGS
jgi:hypothetical protein